MLEWSDIVLRLGAAMVIGGAIGLNREVHHKPTGLRTLGLVSLNQVHGLTTAATIWVTAAIGVLSGVGAWRLLAVAVVA
jgi:putative Mg2+ transporter-C (MgtC) family protein